MMEYLLILVFFLLLFNYVYFISGIYTGLNKIINSRCIADKVNKELVTIIIPFRNESENILKCLNSIENQDYPKELFEVIYINDCSEDDSLIKIVCAKKSSNIKVLSMPERDYMSGHKKRTVKYGIENSRGNIIVSTDCDCVHSKNWLKSILSCFDSDTGFVSGPVSFIADNTLFGRIQALEFGGLILTGAGLIGKNNPVICSAANLAFRKNVFYEVGGYDDNLSLSSGDDEILMQKIAKRTSHKVKFCFDKDAVVSTFYNKSMNQFYQQRKRWASKGLFYFDKLLIVKLILIYLFYAGMFAQLLLGFTYSILFLITLFLSFILKVFVEYLVLSKGKDILFDKNLLRLLLPSELFQIVYITTAGFVGTFGNYKWKERELKR